MRIDRLDHLVLTVEDIERTVDFYTRVLGMRRDNFGSERVALHFGNSKINLHQAGEAYEPDAELPTPGSGDLCFVVADSVDEIGAQLAGVGVQVELGPVDRLGARGPIRSVYLRDPDHNLIELANYGIA